MRVVATGTGWVEALPIELVAQQTLLRGLLGWCESDDAVTWSVLGCSLARGNADALSDLDVAVGVDDDAINGAAVRLAEAVQEMGDLVEVFSHRLPTVFWPHMRVFAQFADRAQLDIVLVQASAHNVPGSIVLYDRTGLLGDGTGITPVIAPGEVTTWSCLAWAALADLGKYLRRRSPWEAHARLEEARAELWRLWALVDGAPEPQYGVTSVLDADEPVVPATMAATVAGLDLSQLLDAGQVLAAQLTTVQGRLRDSNGYVFPDKLGEFVSADLEALGATGRGWST
jgi:predicted nucleotidyltransferase